MPTELKARVPTSGPTGRLAKWLAGTELADVPVAPVPGMEGRP